MSDKKSPDYSKLFQIDPHHVEHMGSLMKFFGQTAMNPMEFWGHAGKAGMQVSRAMLSAKPVETDARDKRFTDPVWDSNPAYRALKNGFLSWCNELDGWVDGLQLEERDRERARLMLSTFSDTIAPTNTLLGNPSAIKKTLDTGGKNLIEGFKNFIGDMSDNNGMPSMVDKSQFEVGGNLAISPGKVVFRDDYLEIVQYQPTTAEVNKTPIFLVPPQINKFYIYDIAPERSMIEYLVSQGQQVFAVSWYNPTAKQSHWSLDDYVRGLDEATEAVCNITGSKQLHMVGACSGGITISALLGYWQAKGIERALTATLLVTILDTDGSRNTSMGLMTSLEAMELARVASAQKGVLEGRELAMIFAWLRPNELIWNYWVNNYLMGNAPPAFDILYWNADTTNLPAQLHSDFIDVLEENAFTKPNAVEVLGEKIDMSKVTCDGFIVGATTDHITPWDGCFRNMNIKGGKNEFILSSSGHIQAIVNPPTNKRAKFLTNGDDCTTAEEFLAGAQENTGSWWDYFVEWINARSEGTKKTPKALGNKKYKPLAEAPGTYVKMQDRIA